MEGNANSVVFKVGIVGFALRFSFVDSGRRTRLGDSFGFSLAGGYCFWQRLDISGDNVCRGDKNIIINQELAVCITHALLPTQNINLFMLHVVCSLPEFGSSHVESANIEGSTLRESITGM